MKKGILAIAVIAVLALVINLAFFNSAKSSVKPTYKWQFVEQTTIHPALGDGDFTQMDGILKKREKDGYKLTTTSVVPINGASCIVMTFSKK